MPFRGPAYTGVFNADDLKSLQQAFLRCCEILGCCPETGEDRDILARFVMRAFEFDDSNIDLIVERAVAMANVFQYSERAIAT